MKILSLSLTNMRVHADTAVTFHDGITGIVGNNESGKSTLATEAVLWALYGAPAIRPPKAGLRWKRAPAKRPASVTLRFQLGGKVYEVVRSESDAKVWEQQTPYVLTGVADGTKPANEYLAGLIGMSLDEFLAAYVCRQKDVARLATMQPAERESFVRKVMGVERVDTGLKRLREDKNLLARHVSGLQQGLGERAAHEAAVEEATGALDSLAIELRDATAARNTAAQREQDAWVAAKASQALQEAHNAALRELDAADRRLQQARRDVASLCAECDKATAAALLVATGEQALRCLPDLRTERDELRAARMATVRIVGLRSRQAALDREIEGPDGLRFRIAVAEAQVAAFNPDQLDAAEAQRRSAWTKYTEVRDARLAARTRHIDDAARYAREADALLNQQQALERLGGTSECPTCFRVLGDRLDVVIANLLSESQEKVHQGTGASALARALADPSDREMALDVEAEAAIAAVRFQEQRRADAELARRQLGRLTLDLAAAVDDAGAVSAELEQATAVRFSQARLDVVEHELARLEAEDRLLAQNRVVAGRLDTLRASLETATADEAVACAAVAAVVVPPFDPDQHAAIMRAAESAQRAMADARVALARTEQAYAGALRQLVVAKEALDEYDGRATALRDTARELQTYTRTDERLGAFRTSIAATMRPELEEYASGFVNLLTDGRHEAVTLDEHFGLTLLESGVPMEVASGGCEDIAALAMRLAIGQMIAQRAGHPLELLILDEPFGSLDAVRRGNVMTLLRRLSNAYRQILLISHVEETRDCADHIIELEFDEAAGRTRVVGSAALAEVA